MQHGINNKNPGVCALCEVEGFGSLPVPGYDGVQLLYPDPHILCKKHWFENIRTEYHFLDFKENTKNKSSLANNKKEYNIPWKYSYKLNKSNFRSIEFHENTEILALGCSHTFGVGVPIEFIWPTFVSNLTGIKDVVNLAITGSSVSLQVRLLANYINKYNAPKIVLCNFPDFNRYEMFDDFGRRKMGSSNDANFEDFSKSLLSSYMQNLQAINFLESICKTNNIKLVWQCWSKHVSIGERLSFSEEFLTDTFKNFITIKDFNIWDLDRDKLSCQQNTNNIVYTGDPNDIPCCTKLYNETKEFFYIGYDRYKVAKKFQNVEIDEEFFNKNLSFNTKSILIKEAHFGAHAHWHWAKNLVENI